VVGSYNHGNVLSGSTKFWEILEWLSDWRFLEKDCAPWSLLIYFNKFYLQNTTDSFSKIMACT
jgi:hypothetical protein